jgi:hypothetical protein
VGARWAHGGRTVGALENRLNGSLAGQRAVRGMARTYKAPRFLERLCGDAGL